MPKRYKLTTTANRQARDGQFPSLSVIVNTPQYDILVMRMSIQGPINTLARVYVGQSPDPVNFEAVSYFGQIDDADFESGILVTSADKLIVSWYSVASPNSILNPANITNALPGVATAGGEYVKADE